MRDPARGVGVLPAEGASHALRKPRCTGASCRARSAVDDGVDASPRTASQCAKVEMS